MSKTTNYVASSILQLTAVGLAVGGYVTATAWMTNIASVLLFGWGALVTVAVLALVFALGILVYNADFITDKDKTDAAKKLVSDIDDESRKLRVFVSRIGLFIMLMILAAVGHVFAAIYIGVVAVLAIIVVKSVREVAANFLKLK